MKRYLLTSPAFIASALLAEGSIITQDDLGYVDGKPQPAPKGSIEVDKSGNPVTDAGADLLQAIVTGEHEPQSPLEALVSGVDLDGDGDDDEALAAALAGHAAAVAADPVPPAPPAPPAPASPGTAAPEAPKRRGR